MTLELVNQKLDWREDLSVRIQHHSWRWGRPRFYFHDRSYNSDYLDYGLVQIMGLERQKDKETTYGQKLRQTKNNAKVSRTKSLKQLPNQNDPASQNSISCEEISCKESQHNQ